MKFHLLIASMAVLTGCAVNQPYTDTTISAERKAYIHCAVGKAYSLSSAENPALDIARMAVKQCEQQKLAVYGKLIQENARRSQGKLFAGSYVDELSSTMVTHIAERLDDIRMQRKQGKHGEKKLDIMKNI